jgi:hypothetical protein
MTLLDFIAFFIYTVFFAFIVYRLSKKIKHRVIRKYFIISYWVKVFACFCYSIFILYISWGDSASLFFPEGYNLYKLILQDPKNIELLLGSGSDISENIINNSTLIGYFNDPSNFMIMRITAVLCFFSFGKFMVVNLMFAMIAFTGIWKLFLFFYEQYPTMHRQIAISILYLPTFVFWSSGILKEAIAVSALGWFTYAMFRVVYSRKHLLKNLLIVFFTVYIFSIVKVYILAAYLPAFIIFLLLKNAMLVKNVLGKSLLIIVFIAGSILGFIQVADNMQSALVSYAGDDITKSIAYHQEVYRNQESTAEGGSYFTLGVEFDGSGSSLAKIAPAAVVATLYRPYLWESKKLSTLISSLESLAFMLFTLYVLVKTGIKNFFTSIFKYPVILYSLMFSIVFALFVGATTLNFGTLVRYKIPAMPFYVISLFFILHFNKKIKPPEDVLPVTAARTAG